MSIGRQEKQRHELLEYVTDHAEAALKKSGIEEERAIQIATSLADGLADQFGGQVISFPAEYHRKLARRDAEILAKFDGQNLTVLAREYGISERGMRKALARATARKKSTKTSTFTATPAVH
jgi:Mor family transcriptional regulator